MSNPTAAMLVIGAEILSGRTQEANAHYLAVELSKIGIDLQEIRVVSDVETAIISAVQSLSKSVDYVFTSGGIGPTHDDITADCIAKAFNKSIDVRADARAILEAHYERSGQELNEARLRMARIPADAELIDNPVSSAPGFKLKNVHVMAGVPSIFKAMVASVLTSLSTGAPLLSKTLRVVRGEGDIASPLAEFAALHVNLNVGCYPFQSNGIYGANVVIRGTDEVELNHAFEKLEQLFS